MQPNLSQTATLTNTQSSPINQTITPDYTGIYIIFLVILLYCIIYKISEKWRLSYYRLRQKEILKNGEENCRLIKKLDKVLEILINGTCG